MSQSCSRHSTPSVVTKTVDSIQIDTAAFLSAFKLLTDDSISLNSSYNDFEQNSHARTKGKLADEKYATLFPKECFGEDNTFSGVDSPYAIGRFDIDAKYQAYLLRHPGMYNSSQISMYIYDRTARHFTDRCMLVAESWGDAGDYFYVSSLIKNLNKTNLTITLDKGQNQPDPADSLGYRYDNFDSTLVYTFDKGNFILKSAVEVKRWQNEPMRGIMDSTVTK